MTKALRYGLRTLAGFLLLWLLVMGVTYVYFRTHKAALTTRATTFLNSRFKGSIHIKDISLNFFSNFPYPALQINGVAIDDSVYAKKGQHTVYLEKIRVVPGFRGLWRGAPIIRKVVLENGSFYLYRDSSNYYNGYVYASRRETPPSGHKQTPVLLPLRVEIHQVDLTIADSIRHKCYSFDIHRLLLLKDGTAGDSSAWTLDMDVIVRSLAFKTYKGSFIQDQEVVGRGHLGFSMATKELAFKGLDLNIDKQALIADGDFRLDTAKTFRLHIAAPSLTFTYGRSWLPWKIGRKLDSLSFDRPLGIDADIEGGLAGGNDPKILVRWTVAHNRVSGYVGTIDDCSFTGYFNNTVYDSLPPCDANSVVCADSMEGNYARTIPIHIHKLEIIRLDTALLSFDLSVHNPVSDWQDLIQSEALSFDKGKVDLELNCQYPLTDSTGRLPSLSGRIQISDAEITYVPRGVKITDGQVHLKLDHQDVVLDLISGNIGKSHLVMRGTAHNFLTRASTDTGKMVLDWEVYSPSLDGTLLLPFLGKGLHKSSHESSRTPGRLLDGFIKRCRMNTDLHVDKFTYNDFKATNVSAALLLDKGVISLPHLGLNTAGGNISVSGSILPYGDDDKVSLNATFTHIDLSALFYAFDDFGQESLSSKNIFGTLNAQTDLSILLTDKGKKIPGSLDGSLHFSIDSGALLNFSPLTKLSNFAFKNRDFTHVYFSKLYDTFGFTSDTLSFNQMEIQSSVLQMFVEGVYKLDGSYTETQIQVPFSNLKNPKHAHANVGVNTIHGPSLFVRAYNTGQEPLHYKFGLFKKKVPGINK